MPTGDPMDYSKIRSWVDEWGGGVDYLDYLKFHGDLALVIALSRLFWPSFVEVEGCVLWDRGFEEQNFSQWYAHFSGDTTRVEEMLNQFRVWQLVESDDVEEDREALDAVASRISSSWKAALAAKFPDRDFDIRVIRSEDGPVVTFSSRV